MHVTRVLITRAGAGLAALAFVAHAACTSDEPETPAPLDGGTGNDAAATGDAQGSVNDAGADAAPACPDKDPVDCSYDAGAVDAGALPGDLRCTGLYSCWSTKTVAASAVAFKPSTELWSDGAEKSRWLALPPNTKIDITKHDGWVFPVGTKAFKEFKVGGKRIETRIWQKVSDTGTKWEATVYRWSADGESSAKRLDTGELVPTADGPVYEVPNAKACIKCHGGRDDTLLGVEEWSLGQSGATGLTLTKLKELDLVTPAPATTTLTVPEDGTGKAAAALAWLHINCGFCHNDDKGIAKFTNLFMDLKTGVTDVKELPTWVTAVNQPMRTGSHFDKDPFTGMNRIEPGDSSQSLVPVVDATRDPDGGISPDQMPPIIVRKVDPKAAYVRDWIDALTP